MSGFLKSLSAGATSIFGSGNYISGAIDTFAGAKATAAATGYKGVSGFLFQTGAKLAENVATQKLTGGQQAPAYQVPMPKSMDLSTTSSVRPGQFTSRKSQFRMPGAEDARVMQKIAAAVNSNSNLIRAQLEVVGVRTPQGRRTRALEESTLGKAKT